MANPHSYLAGLRRELDAAERLDKPTVDEIRKEIERVEEEIAGLVKPADVGAPKLSSAAATPSQRNEMYLAALKRELAAKPRDPEALKAEIKRVESLIKGDGESEEAESGDNEDGDDREAEEIETAEASEPIETTAGRAQRGRR